jgi:hypothetical protein
MPQGVELLSYAVIFRGHKRRSRLTEALQIIFSAMIW